MDDEDLDLLPEPQPSSGTGYDDAHQSGADLTRPLGGYTISDEEEREEQHRVYREEGDVAVAEHEEHLEQQREDGLDPPRGQDSFDR